MTRLSRCSARVLMLSTGTIAGLTIEDNEFANCNNDTIIFDQRLYSFETVNDIYVAGNMVVAHTACMPLTELCQASSGYSIQSTQAVASLYQANATVWAFNFTDNLLLDTIHTVTYSIQIEAWLFGAAVCPLMSISEWRVCAPRLASSRRYVCTHLCALQCMVWYGGMC